MTSRIGPVNPILENASTASQRSRRMMVLAGVFAVLFASALPIDLNVLAFVRADRLPGDLRKLLSLAEVFAHGFGIAAIGVAVWVLDPARRRCLPRLLATAYGSGLLADLCKTLVARSRPRQVVFEQIWDSFVGFLPVLNRDPNFVWDSSVQSLPSGHTATAVGLALGLSRLYPRGRWLFACLAVLAACQRIESSAHFLSDTFAGATVGCLVAAICSGRNWLSRWFDRFETPSRAASDFSADPNPPKREEKML